MERKHGRWRRKKKKKKKEEDPVGSKHVDKIFVIQYGVFDGEIILLFWEGI